MPGYAECGCNAPAFIGVAQECFAMAFKMIYRDRVCNTRLYLELDWGGMKSIKRKFLQLFPSSRRNDFLRKSFFPFENSIPCSFRLCSFALQYFSF